MVKVESPLVLFAGSTYVVTGEVMLILTSAGNNDNDDRILIIKIYIS